jgi:hypothetical protein
MFFCDLELPLITLIRRNFIWLLNTPCSNVVLLGVYVLKGTGVLLNHSPSVSARNDKASHTIQFPIARLYNTSLTEHASTFRNPRTFVTPQYIETTNVSWTFQLSICFYICGIFVGVDLLNYKYLVLRFAYRIKCVFKLIFSCHAKTVKCNVKYIGVCIISMQQLRNTIKLNLIV